MTPRQSTDSSTLARAILALALLTASMPAIVGVTVCNCGCMLTQDICHPLQPLNHRPSSPAVSTLAARAPAPPLAETGAVAVTVFAHPARPLEAPDPPPPKLAA